MSFTIALAIWPTLHLDGSIASGLEGGVESGQELQRLVH